MTERPVIGLLMDYQETGDFSSRPYYALRCSYFDAVWHAGGFPMAIPYLDEAWNSYLEYCQGLILPGGFYPFPASLYGEAPITDEPIHPRYAFERELAQRSLDMDKPTLGICAGMQVIATTMGATMYRDVRSELPTIIDHLNERPAEEPAHDITIKEGTQLHKVLGTVALQVNTAHKEALKTLPDTLTISARAEDGVIEGVEVPTRRFFLGVQWHPELFAATSGPHRKLFDALVSAARA